MHEKERHRIILSAVQEKPVVTVQELVDLTFAVIAINAWNRLAVTFRPAVGSYKPAAVTVASA
jgi:alkylhydroperoxidase family enzyme